MSVYHISANIISSYIELIYGDRMKVTPGGCAFDTTVNNGGILEVYNDGYVQNTTLSSGGVLMGSGGLVEGAVIHKHGSANIYKSGRIATATILKDGYLYVNGDAKEITVSAGGILYLDSAGSATVTFDPWIGKITGAAGYTSRTHFLAPLQVSTSAMMTAV